MTIAMSDREEENYEGEEDSGAEGEKSAEEVVQPEEAPDEEKPLSQEMISECLSQLCKTGDGLAHAFVRLDAKDRALTDILLLNSFIHLQFIDVSKNNLKDISPLNALTHLLVLRADYNKLASAQLDELPYLQVASFNYNRIKTTEGLNHPQLEHLSLNYNEITEVSGLDPGRLARLHTLEIRGNKLTTTDNINLPNLKNLFLGANVITKIEGLERLEHLATLHLRDNQIDKLDGFSENLKTLQYLNLRGNNIVDIKEVKKMQCLPLLRAAVFKDNPISGEDDYRLEVLIALRRIERLDKDDYNDDERTDAEETYEQRRQEEMLAQEQEDLRSRSVTPESIEDPQ